MSGQVWFPPGKDPRPPEDVEDDTIQDEHEPVDIVTGRGGWHLTYCDRTPSSYVCRGCGGDRFEAGCAGYATFIRCPACGWERLVHSG